MLGIPDDHGLVCLTPVGVPDEEPAARPRKPRAVLFAENGFDKPMDYEL